MNAKFTKRNKGFTIIELMIVLVIVAILLAIAYPSYVKYVRKANRGEAQQLLLNWSVNQEIWRSSHTTYSDGLTADANGNVLPAPSHDKYDFTITSDDGFATRYSLQAVAKAGSDQLNDKSRDGSVGCGTADDPLTIDQSGAKEPAACWE